jgi:ERCC4-type nuclease
MRISTTKPRAKPALMLAEKGVEIIPIEADEGPVERYILSRRLAVERRTGSGFLRGIVDKSLFTSAIYLREHYDIPILIVEGEVNYTYTSFDPQAVRGALSAMLLSYGLSVLSSSDIDETVELMAMMARQEQTGIPEISLIPKRKATDLADMQRRIVEMLPGCGMVAARDLLQYFGSVKRIVDATAAEFRQVPGIGAKKADQIYQVLNADYEAVDVEKNLEDVIEAAPGLLFPGPVTLLARQHCISTEGDERHIVDMVFLDPEADELMLVELKRGKLAREHYHQIRRYLDHAHLSPLLGPLLEKGTKIRGVLATVEQDPFRPEDAEVSVRVVDKKQVIAVLKQLRLQRLESAN